MDTLAQAWQPDMPVSDEVDQVMQELAGEVESEGRRGYPLDVEAEAMLPWFLIEQAY